MKRKNKIYIIFSKMLSHLNLTDGKITVNFSSFKLAVKKKMSMKRY